ncbi:hypothetical protein [Paenibacillus sp. L3-i20]|uniref:hypothetical protein n=1 Tax=Paenibacillus sp. L3-i20 TaxID=2905833 RepID=UPI001EE0C904|nr:hypothetical protein [Paenibacillus sp. L3-i20]GKU78230.1 hypothetical protein L3i20_v226270 [Paenibacillus sp. L3-i20]
MMNKKHCLFCNELVTIENSGNIDHFSGCMCAPEGHYSLEGDTYARIQGFPYAKKRKLLPFVSAYIREESARTGSIHLTIDVVEEIEQASFIPATLEEKGKRLLTFLYGKSESADEPINLHPLSQHYNLTYSPNLQEFVYIIELLKESEMITREGSVLKLTTLGWSEAMSLSGGKKSKSCVILLSDESAILTDWTTSVFPRIEQCGYKVELIGISVLRRMEDSTLSRVSQSNLVIADLTESEPEIYYAAGYAKCSSVPTIWTMRSSEAEQLHTQGEWIRPLLWDDVEQLTERLQIRIESIT